MIKLKYGV